MRAAHGRHVLVVGAGGNIGSHLVPLLARSETIGRLTLVDRDVYEPHNVRNQAMEPRWAGGSKARLQARRARRIRPGLCVDALAATVEVLPLGRLRADLILACVDSRATRQYLNRAARLLGVPWIDAGVLADGLLARIDCYPALPDAACLECGWDDRDYQLLEQDYPCSVGRGVVPATGAPAGLGALAASLQALLAVQLLAEPAQADACHQVVVDAGRHRHFVTRLTRRPDCRLGSHAPWAIRRLAGDPRELRLADVFGLAAGPGDVQRLRLRMEGRLFVRELTCSGCGACRKVLRLANALRPARRRCDDCGALMVAGGFGLLEELEWSGLGARQRRRRLHGIGIAAGDIVSVARNGRFLHYEIDPGTRTTASRSARERRSPR